MTSCQNKIGPDHTVICGHSFDDHDWNEEAKDESCTRCGCPQWSVEPEPAGPPCDCDKKPGRRHRKSCAVARHNAARFAAAAEFGDTEEPSDDVNAQLRDQAASFEERKTVVKWADPAMFTAEPIDTESGPRVYLLSMTPDPLGTIAATAKMYKGEVVRSLSEVTDEERLSFFEDITKSRFKAPFEFVQFHFLIEGVTRGFTHQMVRQRTATFAQESTRFAVKEDMPVGLPPSIAGTTHEAATEYDRSRLSEAEQMRAVWEDAKASVGEAYNYLVDKGMPAEDARGLLPTNLLTRLHYRTNLNDLVQHAGNRLCTQAQFEWRLVFSRIAEAIRQYNPYEGLQAQLANIMEGDLALAVEHCYESDRWQYETIAGLFAPVCYQTGKCEFKASFDRACSIRNRVDANHKVGRGSEHWREEYDVVEGNPIVAGVGPESVVLNENGVPVFIGAIRPAEWLLNPGAAR